MQSDNRRTRKALTRSTQQIRQHDDQQRPESLGQRTHSSEIDGKSPKELLGLVERDCNSNFALTLACEFMFEQLVDVLDYNGTSENKYTLRLFWLEPAKPMGLVPV